MAIFAAVSLVASLLTGERINLLLRVCSGILAAFVWKPRPYRVIAVLCIIGADFNSAYDCACIISKVL